MPKLPLSSLSALQAVIIGLVALAAFFTVAYSLIQPNSNADKMTISSGQPNLPVGSYRPPQMQTLDLSPQSPAGHTSGIHRDQHREDGQVAGRSSQPVTSTFNWIGIYDTASPSDPSSHQRLKDIAAGGFNLVLNYTPWDGSTDQIRSYLDTAHALGLKIVFSLKDFYPSGSMVPLADVDQHGATFDQVALSLVSEFKDHPAIYGWYTSDERPETPAGLSTWLPRLQQRQRDIRAIDPKHPTLGIMQCYPGTFLNDTAAINQLATGLSDIGFDSYPIPYNDINLVEQCANTLKRANIQGQRWFVIQAFSWQSYPLVPKGQGYDLNQARYPTQSELRQMVEQARRQGVNSILFYSYFDLKKDQANFHRQWRQLTEVVKQMKQP